MSRDVRHGGGRSGAWTAAVWVLALLGTVVFVREGRTLFVPVALSLLAAYALYPAVAWLDRFRAPRALTAALVLAAIVGALGWTAWTLRDDFSNGVRDLPQQVRDVRRQFQSSTAGGVLDRLRQAVQEAQTPEAPAGAGAGSAGDTGAGRTSGIGSAGSTSGIGNAGGVNGGNGDRAGANGTTRRPSTAPPPPAPNAGPSGVSSYLWAGSSGALVIAGDVTVIIFLTYFLILGAESWRARLVLVAGDMLSSRRSGEDVINEINRQARRFLLVRLVTSVGVAVATWLALLALGAPMPAVWGLAAGVLNSVPYFGPLIVSVGLAVVGLVSGGIALGLEMSAVALVITTLEGWLITPPLLGKASQMNTLAVFLGLLFWSWVWGLWGTILAVPLMSIVKAIADHVEPLGWLSVLLDAHPPSPRTAAARRSA